MNIAKKLLPVSLILGSLLTACGGGGSATAPAAIVFDQTNASAFAESATSFAEITPSLVLAVETNLPASQAAIAVVTKLAFDKDRHESNVAAGVESSVECTDGGTTSFSGIESSNSRTGSISFNNCNEDGFVINGIFTVSSSWLALPGSYNNTGSGNITMSFDGQSFTLSLNFNGAGDTLTGDFENDISFSLSIPNFGSFSVTTTSPLVGNVFTGVTSGELVVTGGQGTRIKVTFNANGSAFVYLDIGSGYNYHSTI